MARALEFLVECRARGEACALVTIVAIDGAAPRRVGAQMAIGANGAVVGSYSGGCLDNAVIEEAQRALAEGVSRRLRFGDDSPYIDITLPCGSGLDLQFDGAIAANTVAAIAQALRERRAVPLDWRDASQPPACGAEASNHADDLRITVPPALRLVLAGTGDTLWAMCKLARAADIAVVALSPESNLRAPLDALGVRLHVLQHRHALPSIDWDAYTAAITLFHDHDWELPFLQDALAGPAFLVGAMGSPRTQAARLNALRERGVGTEALVRLRGPLGLLPRARDPQELAVSILAEAMQAYRERCYTNGGGA
jgi:xanthine dehydrogenase accessory factor